MLNVSAGPSVFIVHRDDGNVFIVENKESEPLIDQILKAPKVDEHLDFISIKQEIKEESSDETPCVRIIEYLESTSNRYNDVKLQMRPVVIIQRFDTTEQTVKAEQKAIREQTIAEKWSSDEEDMNDFGPADSTDSEDLSLKVLTTILLKGALEPPTKRPKTLENSNETQRKRLTGKNACKFCATVFASKAERSKHNCKYLQCDPKNFICRVCSKELNKKTFSNHVHHENTTCEYCGKSFSNPRKMRVHIKRFHAGQNTSLNQEKLTEISLLHEARNYYRKTKKIFECDLCGKQLRWYESVKDHMTIHLYDPRHVCKNCGKKFFSRSAVDRHRKNKLCGSKTVEEDEEYLLRIQRYCRFCDQKFLNIIEKTAHLCKYQHHDYSKKVFCRICEKVVTKQNFNNHMETHGDGLICTVCGKKLTGSRTLKDHMEAHKGKRRIASKACEYCFKTFLKKSVLIRHIQKKHLRIFKCELCSEEFSEKDFLKAHVKFVHGPFVCEICGKAFPHPLNLKLHGRTHNNSFTECPICSKKITSSKWNMKMHLQRRHSAITQKNQCSMDDVQWISIT